MRYMILVHASPGSESGAMPTEQQIAEQLAFHQAIDEAGILIDETEDTFFVRDLGRLKLGTKYPAVGEHVADVVRDLNTLGVRPYLLIDVSGVGRPTLDIIEPKLSE